MLRELTEKIKHGRDLTEADAERSLELILSEQSSDEDIASFLGSLADKGETSEEITGFARVMRRLAVRIQSRHEVFVDTAGTGGGASTFNISTAAAFVISGARVAVAKHGNRAITSRAGSADVLLELGVNIDRPAAVSEDALNEIGLCFMFAPLYHPAMKRVAQIRRQLGRRTIFNMIGPLTNPASAPFQIVGVYAEDLTVKLAEALRGLGCLRAWVVHSRDGLDEVSISAETQVAEVKGEDVQTFAFRPVETKVGVPAGGSAAENARLIRGILERRVVGSARDVVVLNAAVALHIATEVNLSKCIEDAEESINSGAALDKLKRLVQAYA
jgi:anthranilate phosphoribosyltransferase/anthranilate synthase/phosphoribosyltransferase